MSTTTSVDLEKRSLNVDAPLGSPIEEKQAESSGSLASLKGVPAVHGQLQPNEEQLNRALTSRQVSMIAIAGCIGTGLFLSTGRALVKGGPASLVLCYSIVGAIVGVVMLCLGEMSAEYPLAGSFGTYATRFVDEPFGFSIGWNYAFNDAISVAGDLTASQLLMDYWIPSGHLDWLPSLFFLAFLVGVNLIHVKAYGELEYWLSLLKVLSIVIFFFLGIAVNVGGNTDSQYIGGRNWSILDAPFVNGFRGFASIFVTASFAYGGTESIGLTAGETKNPSRNIPRVIKRVWARIFIFYVLTTIIIGFNVPYTYPNLSTKSTTTSPFTIVFAQAGAKAGGSFMNTVILTSVISAGNHALFAGARVLYGLSVNRQAPKIFMRTNRAGVPWVSVLAIASVSLIFFGASFLPGGASEVWVWAQNLVGVSNQLAWLCIGVASWRFRRAWQAQGRQIRELKFANPLGNFAAPFVVVSVSAIILIQGWTAFSPWDVESFFANYVELGIFPLLYVVWRVVKRSKTPSLLQIDLDSGRYFDTDADRADNDKIAARESGKLGWAWKAYSWVA